MFGTIICNKNELTKEELQRYQSFYCGLCHAIKARYGQMERVTLNFDMTFLAMLLAGLYEEEKTEEAKLWCPIHPVSKRPVLHNRYLDYAADMTILLAYYKAKDDWEDERKKSGRRVKQLLEEDYRRIEQEYPRQVNCVKESLECLSAIEQLAEGDPDEAVKCSGRMLSEIFVYQEDFWAEPLRRFGYELGRFIYLTDAALDYEKDKKKGNYNPLYIMGKKPEEVENLLTQAIGSAAVVFEKLPIVQDAGIMRNIIYSGVWQQYHAKIRKGENDGK